jgi:hypothetical protein
VRHFAKLATSAGFRSFALVKSDETSKLSRSFTLSILQSLHNYLLSDMMHRNLIIIDSEIRQLLDCINELSGGIVTLRLVFPVQGVGGAHPESTPPSHEIRNPFPKSNQRISLVLNPQLISRSIFDAYNRYNHNRIRFSGNVSQET